MTGKSIFDQERLTSEYNFYQDHLDIKIEEAYKVGTKARSLGLDFENSVEIPRASDLASRTEKLLEDPYLYPNPEDSEKKPLRIEEKLREMLIKYDRETAAIQISLFVAREMNKQTGDKRRSIDSGLRVGLAVLTEAVLVAPLAGIGDVRILNNEDGTDFLSIDFCGPIRAAGGTAQALGVLIGDILRRELGVGKYNPTNAEIERVKEEFGLYRKGLQFRPSPDETGTIVGACPVMINGEETEKIECAGFKEVRNVVNVNGTYRTRVRGGVMLVIGEGLCLKAPKVQTHTERLEVPGWEFITHFANKGKVSAKEDGSDTSRIIPKNNRYMGDVIAGRPIFGEPCKPGGFRHRYGRSRSTGLAAAGLNPISMTAMGGFLSVGTQMKIERPGKACAVTPCIDIDGPRVLLDDGEFLLIRTEKEWDKCKNKVISIWDSGEILLGYGEFLENNKNLVPASYSKDWWSSDLAEAVDTPEKLSKLAEILSKRIDDFPPGLPFNGAIERGGENKVEREWRRVNWNRYLRNLDIEWGQATKISEFFGCAIPPPWNYWWSDLPIHYIPHLISGLETTVIKEGSLIIRGAVNGWSAESDSLDLMNEKVALLVDVPGLTEVSSHGIIKSSLMTLGIEHKHVGDDIVISKYWEGLVETLGFEIVEGKIRKKTEIADLISSQISELENAKLSIDSEAKGEEKSDLHINSKKLLEDYEVDRSLMIIRKISKHRWEDAVPCRIGGRMGRPEKSDIRKMKPKVHSLFPIGENGGPQRLFSHAASKGQIRVEMGIRICQKCGKETPHLICHHKSENSTDRECGGRTNIQVGRNRQSRRLGVRTTVDIGSLLEVKSKNMGLDRIPKKIKAVKGLISEEQTPEPIEKGILRAIHDISVYRDGTARYDMSDVPVTHFKPIEIRTSWEKLRDLGYVNDIYGNLLSSDSQILELFPQDIIPSLKAKDHLLSTCMFIDDLLVKFYGLEPFYNVKRFEDIVGHIAIGLAPHTSGGVACRIIGWSSASAGYGHPLFHAAKRRNCDGDEDSIMMLLDGLLNFSNRILPIGRGGKMDAPLVLTTRLNPSEIDKEARNVDCDWSYSSNFYESTLEQPHSRDVRSLVNLVDDRLGSIGDIRGYGWTHDSGDLDSGPENSSYKTLLSMEDKMLSQLELGRRLRAVDANRVAKQVIESHFLPDLRGNLMAFTRQKVRCVKCGKSYRRMPLAGKCIQYSRISSGFRTGEGSSACGGNVILTVSQGAVRKYIRIIDDLINNYDIDDYTMHRVQWMKSSVNSLFNNDKVTVMTLQDFL
tara:strand:+ start:4687 stop:8538 length:3852 start_codon:yes stop_codon:yes gene_type:complete